MIANVFFILRLLDFVLFTKHIVLKVIFITTLVTWRILYDSFYLSAKPSTDGLARELRFNFVFFNNNYLTHLFCLFYKKKNLNCIKVLCRRL